MNYTVVDAAQGTFGPGGGTVSTGTNPTPTDPVESTIVSPVAGTVTVTERATASPAPVGYTLLGNEVVITAPAATPANPLILRFSVDALFLSIGGATYDTVQIFRNGAVVPSCTNPGVAEATPDPCIFARTPLAGGDAEIAVYTSAASVWSFGVRTQFAFKGFVLWRAFPTINSVTHGTSLAFAFSLGGDQGMSVLATGYPKSQTVSCTSTIAVPGQSSLNGTLAYGRLTKMYAYIVRAPRAWKGTCQQIVFRFIDGSERRVLLKVR